MPVTRGGVFRTVTRMGLKSRKTASRLIGLLTATTALCGAAYAQDEAADAGRILGMQFETFQIVQFAVFAGALIAAFASASWMIKERGRIASQNAALRGKLSTTQGRLTQMEALSSVDGQRAIVWAAGAKSPIIIGSLDPQTGAPEATSEFVAFGRWLTSESAQAIDHEVAALRTNAKTFFITVETKSGAHLDVTGRTAAGSAIIRFSNLSPAREQLARLHDEQRRIVDTLNTMQALLDKVDIPFWLRGHDGKLTWANQAYAKAVDCSGNPEVIEKQAELFGAQARTAIAGSVRDGLYDGDLSTVVHGNRVIYHVTEARGPYGSSGQAIDRSETEAVREELSRTIQSHEETLNELTTAVAMFDADATLLFYNNSFQELWGVDGLFLSSKPNMSMFLDRMREQGQLPEMPEWRRWKQEVLDAFKSVDPQSHLWHLPDRRTLRVFANPHPRGGMTWIFENLTERIHLESQYKTMQRVQGETLDHLAEGVAVFASDGSLKLANPAFSRFWNVQHLIGEKSVHVRDLIDQRKTHADETAELWEEFAGLITDFAEDRVNVTGRCSASGVTLSWMVVPLPNGQTMLTFVDMSASEQVERALRDRNDALEQTAEMRNRFIKHVSHELRAPLTTIKGFTDMLLLGTVGALSESQSEYVNHIASASGALVKITDAILDLASIDAGVLELKHEAVDPREIMERSAAAVEARLSDHDITLAVSSEAAPETLIADSLRLQQCFENILNNAADFAPDGSTVSFKAEKVHDEVVFTITDEGPGITKADADQLFERFHTDQAGRNRGAGLGLALVKGLVDMHGGEVSIKPRAQAGTEVRVMLPQKPASALVAAE
ncbi:MAG: ATP-binding protein [Pseudomonadota bacterium]